MERSEFEKQREVHVDKIRESLEEATQLMSVLNHNLKAWSKMTGETDKLVQVWAQFQQQLVLLSEVFGGFPQ